MTIRKRGFTFSQVPIWITCDERVSDGAARLFAYLYWRQGSNPNSWPSIETVATEMRKSEKTIQRRVDELERAGYLLVTERPGTTNLYEIIADPEGAAEAYTPGGSKRTPDKNDTPPRTKMTPPPTQICRPLHNERESFNQNHSTTLGDDENQKPRADFEQLFGRAVAVEEKELIDWTDPEARNARLMDATRAFYGNAPDVSDAARSRIRARDGIEASTLLEVHAELIEAGLSEPGSDAGWREWRPMLVAVYQECGGDLSRVNVAAQAIAERGRYAGRCSNWHNVARDAVTEAVEVSAPGMSAAEALR